MNKKGFTLVELLAAFSILGVLMMIAIPAVTTMIEKNRSKIYITDAEKLISLAEYNLKAKSSQIQLPPRGQGIVLTLKYLDNGDFRSSPSDGEYDPNLSFVVGKNTANGMVFSVMMIEKIKGGTYRGIKLTTRESLLDAKASSKVKNFTAADIGLSSFTINSYYTFINTNLGSGYISAVKYLY